MAVKGLGKTRASRVLTVAIAVGFVLVLGGALPPSSHGDPSFFFTVDTTADTHSNPDVSGPTCADANGNCSLRAAIEKADSLDGETAISLPAGTYDLSLGDLDVSNSIDIVGAGARTTTIVQGTLFTRVFQVDDSGVLAMDGVTVTGGNTSTEGDDENAGVGGGFWVDSGGELDLLQVTVDGNCASNSGGGIDNDGTLTIFESTISNNLADSDNECDSDSEGGLGIGGGIDTFGSDVTVANSTIAGNEATHDGGGIFGGGGDLEVFSDTLAGNTIDDDANGGDSISLNGSSLEIGSTILDNHTLGNCDGSVGDSVSSEGYNVSSDDTCGLNSEFDDSDSDTFALGNLQDNGGPTDTIVPSGDPVDLYEPIGDTCLGETVDQRGFARPAGSGCDSGSLEVGATAPNVSELDVNTTADTDDADVGDGVCADADGNCSLRGAIEEAGEDGGDITIVLPAGTYNLTQEVGVLDVDQGDDASITIVGAGARSTVISETRDYRVMQIEAGTVELDDVTVQDGTSDTGNESENVPGDGGGILVQSGAELDLNDSTVTGNCAGDDGGGIFSEGSLFVERSTISENVADGNADCGDSEGGDGDGGGIATAGGGSASVDDSTVSGNTATDDGAGIYNDAELAVTNDTIAGNEADDAGGAIAGDSDTEIAGSILDSPDGGNCDVTGYGSNGDNIVSDDSCNLDGSGDQNGVDPLIGDLANNGGETDTQLPQAGSPAIDAYAPDTDNVCQGSTEDQRGVARPQGTACDIGSVEVAQGSTPPPPASPTAPTVSSVSPSAGSVSGGTPVVIRGSGFTGAEFVSFGGTQVPFTIVSDTEIDTVSPPGVGTVDVTVQGPGGTSSSAPTARFGYLTVATLSVPAITTVKPAAGLQAGGTRVVITGSSFTGATNVSFGGVAASYTVVSDTEIDAVSPPGHGTVDITVTGPLGTSPVLPADQFVYLPPPVSGVSIDILRATGTVLVNGKPLVAGEQIPVGSIVDTRSGTITLYSISPTGTLQGAQFSGAIFQVEQAAGGVTVLVLEGGNFGVCTAKTTNKTVRHTATADKKKPKPPAKSAKGAKKNTTAVRGLWGNGEGKYETKGHYAAATVRGTVWHIVDRCDGTLVSVIQGTVTVSDLVRHKTIAVTAGHSYLVTP